MDFDIKVVKGAEDFPHISHVDIFTFVCTKSESSSLLIDHKAIVIPPYSVLYVMPRQHIEWRIEENNELYMFSFSRFFFESTANSKDLLTAIEKFNSAKSDAPIVSFERGYKSNWLFVLDTLFILAPDTDNKIAHELIRNLIAQTILISCLSNNNSQICNNEEKDKDSLLVDKFRELIEAHYITEKKVAYYIDKLQVKPRNLNMATKKVVGKTPKDLIVDHIILEAEKQLVNTSKGVKQIAWDLGFKDWNNFSAFFHKTMGLYPKDFRKQHKS